MTSRLIFDCFLALYVVASVAMFWQSLRPSKPPKPTHDQNPPVMGQFKGHKPRGGRPGALARLNRKMLH